MTPKDGKLQENHGEQLPDDDKDVSEIWWLELRSWIDENLRSFLKGYVYVI